MAQPRVSVYVCIILRYLFYNNIRIHINKTKRSIHGYVGVVVVRTLSVFCTGLKLGFKSLRFPWGVVGGGVVVVGRYSDGSGGGG